MGGERSNEVKNDSQVVGGPPAWGFPTSTWQDPTKGTADPVRQRAQGSDTHRSSPSATRPLTEDPQRPTCSFLGETCSVRSQRLASQGEDGADAAGECGDKEEGQDGPPGQKLVYKDRTEENGGSLGVEPQKGQIESQNGHQAP